MYGKRILKKFFKDEFGGFAILFGLVFTMLVGVTGAAMDYARGHLLKSELTSALDAAALAAGSSASSDNMEAIAQKYFDVNFPDGYMAANVGQINFTQADDVITLSVSATLNYSLMEVFTSDVISVAADTEVTLEKRGMEIVLVMDNTGSMLTNDQIGTMKTAALSLIDILYGSNEEVDDLWVGLVPFVASVNIGNQYTGWVSDLNQSNFWPSTWKGCVMARDLTDDNPTVGGKWNTYWWYSSGSYGNWPRNRWKCSSGYSNSCVDPKSWVGDSNKIWETYWDCYPTKCHINENHEARNYGKGPNRSCSSPITPLTKSKTTIQAGINEMQSWADGGTLFDVGLVWGWRVISPKWRGLWDGVDPAQPFDYDEPLVDKVVVILTDGEASVGNSMSAYGVFSSGGNAQEDQVEDNLAEVCTNMKNENIILYTITFNVSSSSTRSLFENCATSPAHYFNSPTNAQLDDVFQQIGDSLSNLRISK